MQALWDWIYVTFGIAHLLEIIERLKAYCA